MDAVFKALADPTRRRLLDQLFKKDGQTLGALERRLPMTRFGVMKHLRVLEEARLVVTRRQGREKLHFLNTVPIYIKTTPERLWQAIKERPDLPPQARRPEFASGETLEADPPRRLVQRMVANWSEDVKREGPSRATWEIEPVGSSCRLRVTHDELREGANEQLYGGWPMILSTLKTLLETGESLETPMSLHFARPANA
jgi:DNA-binding transcriptional ArsR family regulator